MAFQEDRDSLINLMESIYHWVGDSHNGYEFSSYADWLTIRPFRFVRNQAVDAWTELQEKKPLERVIGGLREAREEALIQVGLWGEQLRYKLDLLRYLAIRALGGKRRAMEKFTELLEVLLDSLLELLGFGDPIKELVGALKSQVR
jgi:hypothetical protein